MAPDFLVISLLLKRKQTSAMGGHVTHKLGMVSDYGKSPLSPIRFSSSVIEQSIGKAQTLALIQPEF